MLQVLELNHSTCALLLLLMLKTQRLCTGSIAYVENTTPVHWFYAYVENTVPVQWFYCLC
jgi:hypothetical protein